MDYPHGLAPNPIDELFQVRDAGRAIHAVFGEQARHNHARMVLAAEWRDLRAQVRTFVGGGTGVLVRNKKAAEWFDRRSADADTLPIIEPVSISLLHADGGRGRVIKQPQLLDLVIMLGRQFVDIKRRAERNTAVRPAMAFYRGLVCAKAGGYTPELDSLRPGLLAHRQSGRAVMRVTPGLIAWLRQLDLDKLPSVWECAPSRFNSADARSEGGPTALYDELIDTDEEVISMRWGEGEEFAPPSILLSTLYQEA